MTSASYNGIEFGMIRTTEFSDEPVYDPSGTDMLYTKHTIRFETIFTVLDNGESLPFGTLSPGATVADLWAKLDHHLNLPRRPFRYAVNGVALVETNGIDAANGPKVKCRITPPVTGSSFRVVFEAVVCLAGCDTNYQLYASNRWSQTTSIDDSGFATYTTIGRIITRSNVKVNPSQLSGIAFPTLPNNCIRRLELSLQEDGLALEYRITDVEAYILPPRGMVKMRGEATMSTANYGATCESTVSLELTGAPSTDPTYVMNTAVFMAQAKLASFVPGGVSDPKVFVFAASYGQFLDSNAVRVTLKSKQNNSRWALRKDLQNAASAGARFADFLMDSLGGAVAPAGVIKQLFGNDANKDAKQAAVNQMQNAAQSVVNAGSSVGNAVVPMPPFQGITSSPLRGTSTDAPGIDPALLRNRPLMEAIAAALRDPCTVETIGRNLKDFSIPGVAVLGNSASERSDVVGAIYNPAASKLQAYTSIRSVDQISQTARDVGNAAVEGLSGADPYPGVYEVFVCDIIEEVDSGGFVLPTTVPGEPSRFVRLFNDLTKVKVEFSQVKIGGPPVVPVAVDDNLRVLRRKINRPQVGLAADGITPVFGLSGWIEYGVLDNSKFIHGSVIPPWMQGDTTTFAQPVPYVVKTSENSPPPSVISSTPAGGNA